MMSARKTVGAALAAAIVAAVWAGPAMAACGGGGYGGGGSAWRVGGGGAKKLSPLAWKKLSKALYDAGKEGKPVALVFTASAHNGPANFSSSGLRQELAASKAIPVRVLPPQTPKSLQHHKKAIREQLAATFGKALKDYRELAKKYGVSANPTIVFLAPDGTVLGRLVNPTSDALRGALKALPAAVRKHAATPAKGKAS